MTSVTMRFISPTLVLVCGFAGAQTGRVPNEGDRAPDFSITTDRGKRISPGAFGGSLLVLNFWETSCVPCVKEIPSLSDFARKFRSEHVVVVAVSGDEDAQKYRRIAIQTDTSARSLARTCFQRRTSFRMDELFGRWWAASTG